MNQRLYGFLVWALSFVICQGPEEGGNKLSPSWVMDLGHGNQIFVLAWHRVNGDTAIVGMGILDFFD